MKKLLLILLIPFISYTQTQIGEDIDGEAEQDHFGRSVSLNSDGSIVAIGGHFNSENGNNAGHVRIFENQSGTWIQLGQDIDGEAGLDYSGISVSLSSDGSIVAIGAIQGSGGEAGYVRIFENQNGTWSQIGEDIDGEAEYDWCGSVSINSDGSTVAIGADKNDGNGEDAGHVRIYENQSGTWTQIGEDIDGESAGDHSGRSVSLSSDGSIVAIGAGYNDGNGEYAGHVRIYENQNGNWIQIGEDIDGEAALDQFGWWSVSLNSDGSIVAIGALGNDGNGEDAGHVRIYENQNGVWTQIGEDIDGEEAGDYFGRSVSISSDGSIVAVGADRNEGNGFESGHVRVYQNIADTWTQIGVDIDGEAEQDNSGISVSLSSEGSIVVIGAWLNSGNGTFSGHARVYDLSALLNSDSFVAENFNIYPNPVSEFLTIELKNNITLEKVHLYNSLGQLVKTSSLSKINVSELASGTYLLQVVTNEGNAAKTIIIE